MSFLSLLLRAPVDPVKVLKGVVLFIPFFSGICIAQQAHSASANPEPGLLFYLSGDHGFQADFAAGGNPDPNFLYDVKILPGGVKGSYLQCGNNQLLSY